MNLNPDCAGKLADWSAAANRLFASGCEAQAFALLSSFAAPLMSLFRTDEGGAVVSIYGGKKSGKTIAHTAAASVWGEPEAYSLASHSGVTRYAKLAHLCHLPAFDDTLASRDPEIVRMFLGNFVRQMKGLEWQTLLIAFSPVALSQILGTDIPGIELEVKVPPAFQVAHAKGRDPLAYDLLSNRGNAGLVYWNYLCQEPNLRWAKKALAMQIAELAESAPKRWERVPLPFLSLYGSDTRPLDQILAEEQVVKEADPVQFFRFPMRAIAACHVAGQIVTTLGILEFDPDRITRWAREKAFGVLPALPAG